MNRDRIRTLHTHVVPVPPPPDRSAYKPDPKAANAPESAEPKKVADVAPDPKPITSPEPRRKG